MNPGTISLNQQASKSICHINHIKYVWDKTSRSYSFVIKRYTCHVMSCHRTESESTLALRWYQFTWGSFLQCASSTDCSVSSLTAEAAWVQTVLFHLWLPSPPPGRLRATPAGHVTLKKEVKTDLTKTQRRGQWSLMATGDNLKSISARHCH